jgi:hypothetical protein
MLQEAELLSRENIIIPAIISPIVQTAILSDPGLCLAIFPAEDRKV